MPLTRRGTALTSPGAEVASDRVDVLLVDDRREDLLSLTAILENPAYNLVAAQSGVEALRKLLARDFAVILVDVLMPEMDGFEFAECVKRRERTRGTPIVFLTAEGTDLSRIFRAYELGAVDYLPKPVDPEILNAKVAVFAELFRRARRIEHQGRELREAERRERLIQISELRLTAERRYSNLAEAIPQIVWRADAAGAFQHANRRWFEYTGITVERARGSGWLAALHEADAPGALQAWQAACDRPKPFHGEFRLRRVSDGAYRWHMARAVPEYGVDGQVVAWLGTATDVEDLKRAVEARDEFLAIASHELRTPLTALKLRLQTLARNASASAGLVQQLASAIEHTERLEYLIDDFLDVARAASGRLNLAAEPVELGALVRRVIERLLAAPPSDAAVIAFHAPIPVVGSWDAIRLDHVVSCLVSTAWTSADEVLVELSAEDNVAEIQIRARGSRPGGDPDGAQRAASSAGERSLSLHAAQQIILAHGGELAVDQALEPGFRVRLPRHAGQRGLEGAEQSA